MNYSSGRAPSWPYRVPEGPITEKLRTTPTLRCDPEPSLRLRARLRPGANPGVFVRFPDPIGKVYDNRAHILTECEA